MTESAPAAPSATLGKDLPTCPTCGATVAPTASFCEECGATLTPIDGVADDNAIDEELESPITLSRPVEQAGATGDEAAPVNDVPDDTEDTEDTVIIARPCANCGGVIGEDGYCQTCGTRAPTERDHYTEQPSSWVAACCDKGIRHFRNEDATAVASDPALGGRAVLVVCDGVSTSVDSDVASLAAARAAREVLLAHRPAGIGVPASQAAATAAALQAAAAKANAAVVEKTAPGSDNAASCTFAAAVIDGSQIVFGNVGDSRVYWVPDPGSTTEPVELSVDDSVAQARIAMGVSREEAENGPQAHAITKWLGRDSPDFTPRTGSVEVSDPGWLVVCSDGLWNYVSEAAALQSLIGTLRGAEPDPLPLSVALVDWANEQGGKDNISVALARHEV
jgi:serine/threonine protein phosphatase PrpC